MLDNMSNKAILAKARAMYGKSLKEDDYKELLRRQTIPEIAAYLKHETHYKGVLNDVEETSVHRGQLEILLRHEVLEYYSRLLKFEQRSNGDFFGYMLVKGEIEQILLCIRLLNVGSSDKFINWLPGYLIKVCSFDLIKLAKIENYDELLEVLANTPYKKIIEGFKPKTPDEKTDVTACEAALMTYYYRWLFETVKKQFAGDTREQLNALIRAEIDNYNILLIYRLKRYFSASEDYIKQRLITIDTRLSEHILKNCLTQQDPEKLLEWMKSRRVSRQFAGHKFENLEQLTSRIGLYRARKNMRFSINAPVVLFSFMILMNAEVDNIVNIIEGKRYNVSDSLIEKLLLI